MLLKLRSLFKERESGKNNKADNSLRFTLARISLSLLIGFLSFFLSYRGLVQRNAGAADFELPRRAAQIFLEGGNPYQEIEFHYAYPYNFLFYYPLPAVLV